MNMFDQPRCECCDCFLVTLVVFRQETLVSGTRYKPVKPLNDEACNQQGSAGSWLVPMQSRSCAERQKKTVFPGIFTVKVPRMGGARCGTS